MRNIIRWCVFALGLVCLGAGAWLLWDTQQAEAQAQTVSLSVTERLHQILPTQTETSGQVTAVETAVEIDGTAYLGLLSIPSLVLELPIASTYSDAQLQRTPCAFQGTLADQNLILAAHNYTAHFGTIGQLALGDSVTLTDTSGVVHGYHVVAQEIVDGQNLEGLLSGTWDLTLFTCLYGDNTQRVVVRLAQIDS